MAIIAASILSADLARLGEDVSAVIAAGADWVHFDVMDNHYVPNLTFGPLVCQALRGYNITAPIDVHLMTQPVDRLITDFAEAGATSITIHPEATTHLDRSLQLINSCGCKAGLAFNPATPLHCLPYVIDYLDLILLMAVNPGFAGQKLLPQVIQKITAVADLLAQHAQSNIHVAVDGGVAESNVGALSAAGANTFVIGSAIFNTKSYAKSIAAIRRKLQ